jgi:phospholipid/cholesterol/gamma-HCH transport system substrate-binding protein
MGLDAGGDPVMLKDGDRIAKTQSAVVIEKLISQFLFDKASAGAGDASAATVKTTEKPAAEVKK